MYSPESAFLFWAIVGTALFISFTISAVTFYFMARHYSKDTK